MLSKDGNLSDVQSKRFSMHACMISPKITKFVFLKFVKDGHLASYCLVT